MNNLSECSEITVNVPIDYIILYTCSYRSAATYHLPLYFLFIFNRDTKITASERMRVGGTPAMASLEIVEPIEKDKGVYTFVMTDTEKTYTRTLELSGQGKKSCELTALALSLKIKAYDL